MSHEIDREAYENETVAMSFSLPRKMKWAISEAAQQVDTKVSKYIRECIQKRLDDQ